MLYWYHTIFNIVHSAGAIPNQTNEGYCIRIKKLGSYEMWCNEMQYFLFKFEIMDQMSDYISN
jgi:hypothetical protein